MSKKVQKQTAKISAALHTEDWNSRFWVSKIPDYKPRTAVGSIHGNQWPVPSRLPKVQSASTIGNYSAFKLESEAESNFLHTEFNIKTEQINEIKNPQSSLLNQRKSKFIQNRKPTDQIHLKSLVHMKNDSIPLEKYLKTSESRRSIQKKSKSQSSNFISKSADTHSSKVLLPKIRQSALGIMKTESKDLNADLPSRPNGVSGIKSITSLEVLNSRINPDEIREASSESEESQEEELNFLAIELTSSYLNSEILKALQGISKEATDEVVLAYLTLSASKILYSLIQEALDEMIPVIAKASYNESKEKEPSELRDEIAEELGEIELRKIIQQMNIEIISNIIAGDYMQLLPLEGFVVECIQEIVKSNKKKVLKIFHFLIDSIVEEEWVEVLAEDVINSMRIERNWNLLPPNLQKEVGTKQKSNILDTLAERVYFDFLNGVVAEVWVESLVISVINGSDNESLDSIMPIPEFPIKR